MPKSSKLRSFATLPENHSSAEPTAPLNLKSSKLRSFWFASPSPTLSLAHAPAHSHARSDYYDVFQTDTTSARMENTDEKKPPCGG